MEGPHNRYKSNRRFDTKVKLKIDIYDHTTYTYRHRPSRVGSLTGAL